MIPVIAIVGRPNVGKSTLFNRLTRTRDAIVADFSGLTRDRKYGEATINERRVIIIDTAGITGGEQGIDAAMTRQSLQAIRECDALIMMFDAQDGVTAVDQQLMTLARQAQKPVFYAVNKIDGKDPDVALADFYSLGIAELHPLAVAHNNGVNSLMEEVLAVFPQEEVFDEDDEKQTGIKIAVVGRPNVGKSTLVNRLLGEERVVVYDMPGTTRDSIYIPYERNDQRYTLIDTAGVRRRSRVEAGVEKFSIVKTLQAVADSNVSILLIDAHEGLVEQDLHLLGHVIEAGRAVVVAVNKWDGLSDDERQFIRDTLERRLRFVDFADIHFISALHGSGVGHLYESVHVAYAAATGKIQTNKLTQILEKAVAQHAPPLIGGRRIKMRYAHAGGMNPPIIVIHGNQVDKVPDSYSRYLEKFFREELELTGTPLKMEYRNSDNPYEGKKNKLTGRQIERKKRLIKHIKKSEHSRKKKR